METFELLHSGHNKGLCCLTAALFTLSTAVFAAGELSNDKLIDDFASGAKNKALGTSWEFISDQVMGGESTGKMDFVTDQEKAMLHLTGQVSSKNRGGFIQARLDLHKRRKYFDAAQYQGILLKLKGNSNQYAVHLKTKNTRLGRQHYTFTFQTNGKSQQIKIPFKDFKPASLKTPLDKTKLKSIAIVATEKDTKADIFVDEIYFYRNDIMYKELTPAEERVIVHKGTERRFSGKYNDHYEEGTYTCKRCGAKLYPSSAKFKSDCGWPGYDDEIPNAVKRLPDVDGRRTEILCANCDAHLGHLFFGEGYTPKNIRHCVNSISMEFAPEKENTKRAIFASGCFWGVEYHFKKLPGVISTTVGYTGGKKNKPTYKQVSTGKTGHAEAVEIVYDPQKATYAQLAKLYFETHDFTQLNRQGPDIGTQYRTEIFYLTADQKKVAQKLIAALKNKKYKVKTKLTPASEFWPAEEYHQDYYEKTKNTPYCHIYKKIF